VSHNDHEDIAARLRREASATAPERLRADVMLRVRAEPRPERIRARRGFGRSFATVAAAACVLGALVFGMSRVDLGGSSSTSGGGSTTAAAEKSAAPGALNLAPAQSSDETGPSRALAAGPRGHGDKQLIPSSVPAPLRRAIYGRADLASPLRKTFGALDPYHLRARR
jgi:hypothetical protein